MIKEIQSLLLGKTLRTEELSKEKFNVLWGLPILSSDAISSVAYAVEEILWVLIPILGIASYKNMFYAAIAIVILLFILVFSYRQTIDNYPNGGGSYIVASENLGKTPGLVAAASLTIDYILTVAVSTSAGTAAITSAFPMLLPYKTVITIFIIFLITLGNLRGIRESSVIFGIPTYLFIFSIITMIVTGFIKVLILGQMPPASVAVREPLQDITILLFLKAFASGCTALTGVEAVSDGIPNFKAPAQKRAKRVLTLLALLVLIIFGGLSYLATMYTAVPNHKITVVAQIAIQVFGQNSFMFWMIQSTTALILIMAANTAFADLPLLFSILARDGYMPRQFAKRGKRLSFSNGIVLLFIASSILVYIFKGSTHLLMPLYAVGVFLSFTLSQSGMFMKWWRLRNIGWKHKAFINGVGTLVTALTCIIIGATKFIHGAWVVCICIPILVLFMVKIKKHYVSVANDLKIDVYDKNICTKEKVTNHVIVPVDTFNKSFVKCLNYGLVIGDTVEIYHVSTNEDESKRLKEKYSELHIDIPFIVEDAPFRNVNETLLKYIDNRQLSMKRGEMMTIVMPQFTIHSWWHQLLHNQTSLFIRTMLLKRRNIAVVTLPYLIKE